MSGFDFTKICIEHADAGGVEVDNTPWAQDGVQVRAYFGDLAPRLIEHISDSTFAVGCCAWLTHESVLAHLSQLDFGCQIICQKEDFLRPDSQSPRGWKSKLHAMYSSLACHIDRHACANVARIEELSTGMDEGYMSPVRCVGNHNRDKHPAWPRMHHKFIVFCGVERAEGNEPEEWPRGFGTYGMRPVPLSVWTGSFNPTSNGSKSRENSVVIESKEIASAFFREWFQMFAISESLNWESDWCAPEYRIGT